MILNNPLKFIDKQRGAWSFEPALQYPIKIPMCPDGRIEYMRYLAHNLLFYHAKVHEHGKGCSFTKKYPYPKQKSKLSEGCFYIKKALYLLQGGINNFRHKERIKYDSYV